jgi:hypothetical protein
VRRSKKYVCIPQLQLEATALGFLHSYLLEAARTQAVNGFLAANWDGALYRQLRFGFEFLPRQKGQSQCRTPSSGRQHSPCLSRSSSSPAVSIGAHSNAISNTQGVRNPPESGRPSEPTPAACTTALVLAGPFSPPAFKRHFPTSGAVYKASPAWC